MMYFSGSLNQGLVSFHVNGYVSFFLLSVLTAGFGCFPLRKAVGRMFDDVGLAASRLSLFFFFLSRTVLLVGNSSSNAATASGSFESAGLGGSLPLGLFAIRLYSSSTLAALSELSELSDFFYRAASRNFFKVCTTRGTRLVDPITGPLPPVVPSLFCLRSFVCCSWSWTRILRT